MDVYFDNKLFGVNNGQISPNPMENQNDDFPEREYSVSCGLGQCGMSHVMVDKT